MKSQGILATVGARGWICESHSPLPAGLDARAPVTVVSMDAPQLDVEDADGRTWTVFHWQVDCGVNFCGPAGNWMHESKRQMLNALEADLAATASRPQPTGFSGVADALAESRLRWILERNGRTVQS